MMTPIDPKQMLVEAQHRSLLIIWVVLFMSVSGFLVMTFIIRPEVNENSVLTISLIVMSILMLATSFSMKAAILKKSVEAQDLQYVLRAYIIALALTECAALFGFMIHFITGSVYYFVAMGIGIVGMILHFPKKQHLLDASFKKF
jgi:hypothetical protein